MNIIIIGTSTFAINAAFTFQQLGYKIVGFINLTVLQRPDNCADIESFSSANNIPYYEVDDINAIESIELLTHLSPDYLFVSWPKLLKEAVISIAGYGCIGTHPTLLPANRGRHPLHWSITQGLKNSALSFFILEAGVDSGRLLHQLNFEISPTDDINALNEKVDKLACQGIRNIDELVLKPFHQALLTGTGKTLIDFTEKQATDAVNYWRQKTPFDVMIDLRLPALDIIRIVLSFSTPYPCAILLFEDDILRVSHAEVIKYQSLGTNIRIENLEPGKILSASSQFVCVKSGDCIIRLHFVNKISDRLMNANYIHPPLKYAKAVKKLYSELGY